MWVSHMLSTAVIVDGSYGVWYRSQAGSCIGSKEPPFLPVEDVDLIPDNRVSDLVYVVHKYYRCGSKKGTLFSTRSLGISPSVLKHDTMVCMI